MASLSAEWLKATPGYTNVYCNDGYTLVEAAATALMTTDSRRKAATTTVALPDEDFGKWKM